jgi:hypothetical protein
MKVHAGGCKIWAWDWCRAPVKPALSARLHNRTKAGYVPTLLGLDVLGLGFRRHNLIQKNTKVSVVLELQPGSQDIWFGLSMARFVGVC